MLKHISVQNYALIDKLEMDLPQGLTIITGETGAGKSILLGALALVLGDRADTQSLQDKTKKCVVECLFDVKEYGLEDIFKKHELDFDINTTIRREINPEGKSRAFVNDTPVTLAVLKELGDRLIDIHSQHETLTLNDSVFQLSVVDAFAGEQKLLSDYRNGFKNYRELRDQLHALLEAEAQSKKDRDYLQFQFNEFEEAKLDSISQEEMERELEMLNNAEAIKAALSKAESAMDNGESGLLQQLNAVKAVIAPYAKFNKEIEQLAERLGSAFIELKDVSTELASVQEEVRYDASRIDTLNETLDGLYRLQQKHRVSTVNELIAIKKGTGEKLENISGLEEQIAKIQEEITALEKILFDRAGKLSKARANAIPGIEKEIGKLLGSLGMPDARLNITHEKLETLSANGLDRIVFLFSANKGSAPRELNKVASGGELSRFMLSIKSLIAKLTHLPSVIFDEIDTGVSGAVADKVGSIMENMGKAMQVIAITHLPQIASKGNSHLFVYKEVKAGKTFTRIRVLEKEERVKEIAKMLSTENPTDAAIKNAKELLKA
ncbi:MAG TPA: DNA repair protein RecN [Bacteroidia bacterium]|jgi:DNA repair protein RecN (Recombination protein N)